MCQFDADHVTVLGPGSVLRTLRERWSSLRSPELFGLTVTDIHLLDEYDAHFGAECPGVLVAEASAPVGPVAADMLQAELFVEGIPAVCEPGYTFAAAAGGAAGVVSSPAFEPAKIVQVHGQIGGGTGQVVAVLDSGAPPAPGRMMVDFLGGAPVDVAADDRYGHATAVIGLIGELRPNATVVPLRVLTSAGRADSTAVFLALAFCLWPSPHRPDVINASLTTQRSPGCPSSLGRSLAYLMTLCAAAQPPGAPLPPLVAAAGNTPATSQIGYPALLPAATVVTALDFAGADAGYNPALTGATGTVQPAPGGTSSDPYGTYTDATGTVQQIFGTSFAAAVVSASHLTP
jgi:hypothetical protein